MKEIVKKNDKEMSREEYVYHNTELLLKKFRDVRWSIEVSAIQAQISLELEMDCKLEEFLEMSYAAGLDLTGTHIQEQMRTLERNKKMLKIIETAIQVLRKKQVDGEMFYWILYYTYLWVRLHCEDEIFKKRCGSKDFDVPEEKVLERIETAKNKAAYEEKMIIYEKILSPRSYVEIITGNYYIINDENQYQETKEILRQIGCNKLRDYSLANVKKVDSPRKKFVLVEFIIEGENDELDYECRWCEVPENITTERIIEVA